MDIESYSILQVYDQGINFFKSAIPSLEVVLIATLPFVTISIGYLYLCGWLKVKRNWKTGYTRKLFHFLIFFSVIIINANWGISAVCLFGSITSIVIFYALLKGDGFILYEPMAREKDAPKRSYYIIIPYLSTLVGGLIINIFFQETALFGYAVAGIGDAIAEPVGTKFGKHTYRVMSSKGTHVTRSVEGSLSIFIASAIAIIVSLLLNSEIQLNTMFISAALVIAFISTIIEAVAPHGWDNVLLMTIPSWMAIYFI